MSDYDFPWSKWYENRYVLKTKWFTDIRQDGIYRSLLGHYLESGPLPIDDDELRGICRNMPKDEWEQWWPKIRDRFFFEKNGRLHNKKADEVRHDQRAGTGKKSKAGKAGAEARWGKKDGEGGAGGGEDKAPAAPAPKPTDDTKPAVDAYNEAAAKYSWPRCDKFTEARAKKLKVRLKDCGGLVGWQAALEKMAASDFLMGRTARDEEHKNWKPDLDFLLKESSFTKLMEGKYDNRGKSGPTGPSGGDVSIGKGSVPTDDERRRVIAEAARSSFMGTRS